MKPLKSKAKPLYRRACRNCSDEFTTQHVTKVFCDDSCRAMSGKGARTHTCSRCGVPHPSVTAAKATCIACLFYDQVRVEKRELRELVDWLGDRGLCFYCGDYASDHEHVVPRVTGLPTWIVRACSECNSIAGGELFTSILEKRDYIRARRTKKYGRILKQPEWTEDELADMGRKLRVGIEAAQRAKKFVQSQIEWDPLALFEHAGDVVQECDSQPH